MEVLKVAIHTGTWCRRPVICAHFLHHILIFSGCRCKVNDHPTADGKHNGSPTTSVPCDPVAVRFSALLLVWCSAVQPFPIELNANSCAIPGVNYGLWQKLGRIRIEASHCDIWVHIQVLYRCKASHRLKDKFTFSKKKRHCTCNEQIVGAMQGSCRLVSCVLIPRMCIQLHTDRSVQWTNTALNSVFIESYNLSATNTEF